MAMDAINRVSRRSATPGTKFVQNLTNRPTLPTSLGLIGSRLQIHQNVLVKTQRRMWMNPTLSFSKCATSRSPVRSPLMKPVNGQSSLAATISTTEMAGSQDGLPTATKKD